MRNRLSLIMAMMLTVAHVSAQDSWSLQRCIEYAIEHNIEVKQRILDKESAEIDVNTAINSRLPDLNAGANQNFSFGRGARRDGVIIDRSQANSSFNISANLPVFTGFRIPNEIAVRKLNLLASVEQLNKAREDIALRVTSYYLQVLFNKELFYISKQQVALSQSQLDRSRVMSETGKAAISVVYDAEAMLAKDELALTQSENNLMISLLDLAQLLNVQENNNFDIEEPNAKNMLSDATAVLPSVEEAYSYSLSNRPAIKAALLGVESGKKQLKIAQSNYYPKLSLGGGYSNGYYHIYNLGDETPNASFASQLRNNGSESIGISLSIPIFNRFTVRNSVRSARNSIAARELSYDFAKQTLYKEIEQAYYNALASNKKHQQAGKAVEAARISFEYETQKYEGGKSTIFEYNDAKTRYERARSEEVQAIYEYIFRSKVMEFYNGENSLMLP